MMQVPLYILAGGRSRRFGTDKARADVHGRPMLCHVAACLSPVASTVTVVADVADKYADLGMRTIADALPDCGPMGGLATALADLAAQQRGDWLLLSSCDLADPQADWVRQLLAHVEPGARAVAFRGQWWEPTLALYHVALRPAVTARLTSGAYAMQGLLDDAAISVALPNGRPLPQINTPQAYERYLRDTSQGADEDATCEQHPDHLE